MKLKNKSVNIAEAIGGGYRDFWNYKGRYRIVKGSRGSKKSKTAALWFIYNMMKYPEANTLVVRKTFRTLKDSCYTELKWATKRLEVEGLWKFTNSPLEAQYLPTGQKIYFRGLDDPLKVTSVTVDEGVLCWLWIEEAYEINKEEDFDILNESIRGEVPEGLFKQITLTMNPWSDRHWTKKRFFDNTNADTLAMTTTYKCNEWLDEADRNVFERMKIENPRRYKVAGLGEWGIVEGLVYERWKEQAFDITSDSFKNDHPKLASCFGLDFGYTNDPTALFCGLLDKESKQLFVFDELYKTGLSNARIAEEIEHMGYRKEQIIADSAEPKSIDELKGRGLRVRGAKKGKDSIMYGVQFIQDLEIVIHPQCVNFLTEIGNYAWDVDRFGDKVNKPADNFNHLMDAMRYALETHIEGRKWII